MRALKMRSAVVGHQKLITINWEQSSKLNFLQLYKKLLKNSASTILWSFGIRSKLERWKSSISWCLMNWPKNKKQKHVILKCHLLLYCATAMNHFSVRLWHATKSGFYMTAQWLDREEDPKHFPKPSLHQKKVMVTVWWSAASLIHCSFLNLWDTITPEKYAQQIDKMHQKLQCLQLALVNKKVPVLLHKNAQLHRTTKAWEVEQIGIRSFASCKFLQGKQIFAGKTLRQPARGRKCFPGVHRIPKHGFLCHRNKQTYFLLAKICWL